MSDTGESSLTTVRRPPPANLAAEDARFFEKDLEVRIPEPSIRTLEQIDVSPEGLLFKDGRIIPESFSQADHYAQWKKRSIFKAHAQKLLRKRSNVKRAVWVTDDWSRGYFHWLSDVAPKLLIARREIEEYGLLLPSELQNLDFVRETLLILSIEKVGFVPRGETVRVEELYRPIHTPVSGDFHEPTIRNLRDLFRAAATPGQLPRIYITRRKAKKRRIVNEAEIIPIAREYGFIEVEAEKLSFREQIDLFSGCECLVSIHGAGLVNMLFMPSIAKVLELRKRGADTPNCFFCLASALRHRFYYGFYPSVNSDEPAHSADLIVNDHEFRLNLQRFLRRGCS